MTNRKYALNLNTGIPYFAETICPDRNYVVVSGGFLKRIESGEVPLSKIREIWSRGGDPEAALSPERPAAEKRQWRVRNPVPEQPAKEPAEE